MAGAEENYIYIIDQKLNVCHNVGHNEGLIQIWLITLHEHFICLKCYQIFSVQKKEQSKHRQSEDQKPRNYVTPPTQEIT